VSNRYSKALLCVAVGILSCAVATQAQRLEIHVGYSSSVMASRYAPIRIDLSGVDTPIDGILRVTQRIGAIDQNPDVVTVDLVHGTLDNGTYAGTIPIFDPLNPIDVAVLSSDGRLIVEQSTNVRLFQRTARFPVVSGPAIPLGALEVVVSPSELPTEWWAYESVDSLWINGGGISTAAWQAIAQWVFAGGSIVVFTGEDYYQIESPAFRKLFPLRETTMGHFPDGTPYLAGEPMESIPVVLSDNQAGSPLLYQTTYGAGTVSVVSVRAPDLAADRMADIGARIPGADWYSLLRFGSEFRGSMRVPRPIYLIAPTLVVIILGCVAALRWGIARRRATGNPLVMGITVLAVVALLVGVSVWSGFYANPAKQLVELFQLDFSIQTHATHGISLGYAGFVSPATTRTASIPRDKVSVPTYALVNSTPHTSFSSATDEGLFQFAIQANEVRDFRHYGSPRRLMSFALDRRAMTVQISNTLFYELDVGFVLVDGYLYQIPRIPPGDSSAVLADRIPVRSVGNRSLYGELLEAIIKEYRLDAGTWLLAVSDRTREVPGTQVPIEVRDVQLHLVEEGDE